MTDLQRVEKWQDWMEHGVPRDIFPMHLQRQTWNRMAELIRESPDLNGSVSYFWEYMFDTYVVTQSTAVRRQADTHDQAGSLGRVMLEMSETPEALGRDFWLSLWSHHDDDDRYWQREAESQWSEHFGGQVGDHLDPAIPTADLMELQDGSERVTEFVDLHIAHMDARTIPRRIGPPRGERPVAPARRASDLNLDEVHDAIDLVGRMFVKYASVLTAATWADLTPAIQHNWEAIFEVPWKKPRALSRAAQFRAHREALEAAEDEAD